MPPEPREASLWGGLSGPTRNPPTPTPCLALPALPPERCRISSFNSNLKSPRKAFDWSREVSCNDWYPTQAKGRSRTRSLSPKREECWTKQNLSSVALHIPYCISASQPQSESPLWQLTKLKLEKLKQLSQGHTAGQWQVSCISAPWSLLHCVEWQVRCTVWRVNQRRKVDAGGELHRRLNR